LIRLPAIPGSCRSGAEVDLNYIPADLGNDRIARGAHRLTADLCKFLNAAAHQELDQLLAGHIPGSCSRFYFGAFGASPLEIFFPGHGLTPLLIMQARTEGITASTWQSLVKPWTAAATTTTARLSPANSTNSSLVKAVTPKIK
jgi:hypothetical protein